MSGKSAHNFDMNNAKMVLPQQKVEKLEELIKKKANRKDLIALSQNSPVLQWL